MTIDFVTLANIIFKEKDKYKFVTDEEKENAFFILNRKFALKDIKKAQFFNSKNVDRASAIDIWFHIFYNVKGLPNWWWKTKQNTIKKEKPKFSKDDIKLLKDFYELTDRDIDFLIKYQEDDMKENIKKIKKFKK